MLARRPDLLVCGHGSALPEPMPHLHRMRVTWHQRLRDFEAVSPATLRQFFDPFCHD